MAPALDYPLQRYGTEVGMQRPKHAKTSAPRSRIMHRRKCCLSAWTIRLEVLLELHPGPLLPGRKSLGYYSIGSRSGSRVRAFTSAVQDFACRPPYIPIDVLSYGVIPRIYENTISVRNIGPSNSQILEALTFRCKPDGKTTWYFYPPNAPRP